MDTAPIDNPMPSRGKKKNGVACQTGFAVLRQHMTALQGCLSRVKQKKNENMEGRGGKEEQRGERGRGDKKKGYYRPRELYAVLSLLLTPSHLLFSNVASFSNCVPMSPSAAATEIETARNHRHRHHQRHEHAQEHRQPHGETAQEAAPRNSKRAHHSNSGGV